MRINHIPIMNPVVAVIIAIGILCIILAYVQESKGAQRSVSKQVIPLDADLDNTGCGGEVVHTNNEIHFFTQIVRADDGGLQITTDLQFHVVEAVGLKSGGKYQVTNVVINTQSADAARSSEAIENATVGFQLKGPEKGDDLFVRGFRLKIDPSGQVTVDDSKVMIICGNQRIL